MAMAGGRAFSTLGRRLMDMSQLVGDKRRERQMQEDREREREIAEQRYETSLRLTPGVYEAPPSTTEFVDAPTLNASMPDNPFDRPTGGVGLRMPEPVALDMPNFDVMPVTRPTTLQEGHTRLNDRLAFNPNYQQDAARAEEERRRAAIIEALGDNPNAEAIATGAVLGADLSYRPFTRDDALSDARDFAMIPRWTPPPEPRYDVVTGGDGNLHSFNINTGRMEPTGVSAPVASGNARGPLARTVPSWDTIWEEVSADPNNVNLTPAQKVQIVDAIVAGVEPPTFGAPESAPASASDSPGFGSRAMSGLGDILRAMRTPYTGGGTPSAPPAASDSAFNLSADTLGAAPAVQSPMGDARQVITQDQADFLRTVRGLTDDEINQRYTVR